MALASKSAARPETGQRIGRYRLRRRIGSGGMGSVYLADVEGPGGFGKWFAIKLIHPHFEDSDRLLRMFHEEARIASRVEHPNVCQVVDFGRDENGMLYLVLEYLRGLSLSAIVQGTEAGLPLWLAARVVADAARGLHAAHELTSDDGRRLGLVHRDVSPQNLFVLFAGPCKVLDFGIARIEGGLVTTREGELRGKLGYMSPEQIDDATSVDRRADVWALGVVLWELVTGKRLFHGGRHTDVVVRVLHDRIVRPSKHRPDCDRVLDDITLGALKRERHDRISTAAELADRLEDWIHSQPERTGHAAVASYLKRRFADEVAQDERTLLELSTQASPVRVADVTRTERGVDDPVLPGPPGGPAALALAGPPPRPSPDTLTHARTTPFEPALRVAREPGGRTGVRAAALIAAAVAGAAAATLGAVLLVSAGRDDARAGAPPPATVPPATAAPSTETPPSPPPEPPSPAAAATPGATTATDSRSEPARDLRPPAARARAPRTEADPPRSAASGRLNLLVIPESDVYLRGRRLGRTPLVGTSLPEGSHRLELRPVNGAARRFVVARVRAGQTTRLSVRP